MIVLRITIKNVSKRKKKKLKRTYIDYSENFCTEINTIVNAGSNLKNKSFVHKQSLAQGSRELR